MFVMSVKKRPELVDVSCPECAAVGSLRVGWHLDGEVVTVLVCSEDGCRFETPALDKE